MNITENIQFNELEPLLSKQSDEFRAWYNENIHSKISDYTVPDSLDEYDRPFSFTLEADGFVVTTEWQYIYKTKSNWACADFKLTITPTRNASNPI